MNRIALIYLFGFLFCCNVCCGQIGSAHTIDIDYSQSLFIQDYDKLYINQTGLDQLSIIGHYEFIKNANITYYKSDYSERFSPGVSLGIMDYKFKRELREFYYDIKLNTVSLGIGGKYKLLYNMSRFSINGIGELGVGLQYLRFLEDYYVSIVEDENTKTTYYTELKSPDRSEVFISPYLKLGLDVSFRVTNFLKVKALIYTKGVSYPHFDLDSPILLFEVYGGIGASYLFSKNKRYYNE